ncbi:CDP-alcohol phosphatidyltransferase family protein [Microbacterium pumilum]|uniref:CDP-alcohol phosphatidyltransferase family protein n=1 Tax=Microbacterium pumilum TaxID=344165 RepID=A0ABP5DIW5_9MICO
MQKVHLAPLWSFVGGVAGLALVNWFGALSAAGWIAGLLYLVVSNVLLARGLRRHRTVRFGPANIATATRSTLVGIVTALVATSFTAPIAVPLLIGLTVPALALDAVDGWIARRTDTITELGGRFDMEVDAFLIFALSAYVAQELGWWVLLIGLMRYALAVAGWLLPWLQATVPFRYWRKVVAAIAGVALALAASGLAPRWVDDLVVLIALGLLIESFGRDVVWLFVRHRAAVTASGRQAVRSVALPIASRRRDDIADVGRGV